MRFAWLLGLPLLVSLHGTAAAKPDAHDPFLGRSTTRLVADNERATKEYAKALIQVAGLLRDWTQATEAVATSGPAMDAARVARLNDLLKKLPREWTDGYRIDVDQATRPAKTTRVEEGRRKETIAISWPRDQYGRPLNENAQNPGFLYARSGTLFGSGQWYQLVDRPTRRELEVDDPAYRDAVLATLEQIGRKMQRSEHPRIRAAARRINDLEAEIGRRLDHGSGPARRELTAFLKTASSDEVADLAAETRLDLERLLGARTPRRESILRADARTEFTHEASSASSRTSSKGSLTFFLEPPGIGLESANRTASATSAERDHLVQTSHLEKDELVPGASEVGILLRAPTPAVGASPEQLEQLATLVKDSATVPTFEARVILEKALTLKRLVDHLATHSGGRPIGTALTQWMQTRLVFFDALQADQSGRLPRLGEVVLDSVEHDVVALEHTFKARGKSLLGLQRTEHLTELRRTTLLDAVNDRSGPLRLRSERRTGREREPGRMDRARPIGRRAGE